jgi:hypothetical protein
MCATISYVRFSLNTFPRIEDVSSPTLHGQEEGSHDRRWIEAIAMGAKVTYVVEVVGMSHRDRSIHHGRLWFHSYRNLTSFSYVLFYLH